MEKDILLNELYYQVLKTCYTYRVNIQPDMTYLEMWTALVKKLDRPTRQLLKTRLKADIADKKDAIFNEMLAVLNEHEKNLQTLRKHTG